MTEEQLAQRNEELDALRNRLVECAERARREGMDSLRHFPSTPEFFWKLNDLVHEHYDKEFAQNRDPDEVCEEVKMMLIGMVLFREGNNPSVIREILTRLFPRDWGDFFWHDVLGHPKS